MKISCSRRGFLGVAFGAVALGVAVLPRGGIAQAWPVRPIRLVVGFPPGGLTDLFARAYGESIAQGLGQPVVVENKPGAGSLIACEQVAKAAPDGYTLVFTIQAALVQSQALYKKLPYDPGRDFTFIAAFGGGHLPLAVHKEVPARDFGEFVEFAKKTRVNFGSYAPGSYPHMVASQMNKLYGAQVEVVHFKGEAPMWQELATGRLHAAIGSYIGMSAHAKSGAVRPIAVPTAARSPKLPDVPTFAEQGYREPIFTLRAWLGLLGPAGLPRDIVERISKHVLDGAESSRVRQLHETFGIPDKPTTPAEFVRLYREEGPIWVSIAKELGISLD